eukprot:CFRG2238T1
MSSNQNQDNDGCTTSLATAVGGNTSESHIVRDTDSANNINNNTTPTYSHVVRNSSHTTPNNHNSITHDKLNVTHTPPSPKLTEQYITGKHGMGVQSTKSDSHIIRDDKSRVMPGSHIIRNTANVICNTSPISSTVEGENVTRNVAVGDDNNVIRNSPLSDTTSNIIRDQGSIIRRQPVDSTKNNRNKCLAGSTTGGNIVRDTSSAVHINSFNETTHESDTAHIASNTNRINTTISNSSTLINMNNETNNNIIRNKSVSSAQSEGLFNSNTAAPKWNIDSSESTLADTATIPNTSMNDVNNTLLPDVHKRDNSSSQSPREICTEQPKETVVYSNESSNSQSREPDIQNDIVIVTHERDVTEESPLLHRLSLTSNASNGDRYHPVGAWTCHVKETLVEATPHASRILIHLGPEFIAALYLGQMGHYAFGAAALAIAYMSITGITVGVSFASALDTLVPLSSLSEEQSDNGIHLQRSWLLLLFTSLPAMFLWLVSEEMFTAIGVDSVIADQAADFCRFSIPGLWGMFLYETLKKTCQAQGPDGHAVITNITVFANVWMIIVGWLVIRALGLGYIGVALVRSLMWWMMSLCAFVHLYRSGWVKRHWKGWSHRAFSDWGIHFSLAGPCFMIMMTELWPIEIIVIAAGCMNARQLAVAGILMQFLSLGSIIPYAISVSSTRRIDTLMRKAVPNDCHRAATVSTFLLVGYGISFFSFMYVIRYQTPKLFTSDTKTIYLATKAIVFMNMYLVVDALLTSCRNIMRIFRRQQITFLLNVVCNYLIGIPLALFFVIKLEAQLIGLYKGLLVGVVVQCGIMLFTAFYFSDWNTEIWRLHARLNGETVKEWYDDDGDDDDDDTK